MFTFILILFLFLFLSLSLCYLYLISYYDLVLLCCFVFISFLF